MSEQKSSPTLRRDLGLTVAVAVVVGDVIGSGIFVKPGGIAAEAGNFGLIISVWMLGGALCILGGLCFAELATMYPQAGGLYVYLREAYGKPVAFLYGWSEVIFNKPASIGALAVVFVSSMTKALRWDCPVYGQVLLCALLICGLTIVNYFGVRWGGRMQLGTTMIKAGFLGFVALLPFLLMPWNDQVNVRNYASTITPQQAQLGSQISAVLLAVMWAYNGWHGITPLAEEIKNPQVNIPLALLGGIGILIVLYVGANVAYHSVLSMAEMRDAGKHAAEEMLARLLGPIGGNLMSAVIMCSTFGAINSTILQAPRISFAMGRDRVFFQTLGKVHANYHTPAPAIFLLAVMSVLLIVAVAVGKWCVGGVELDAIPYQLPRKIIAGLKDGTIFDLLTNFVIFSGSIFAMLGVAAVMVMRWKQPQLARPYATLGYPATPLIFLAVYCWFLMRVYDSNPLEAHTGLLMILAGVPVYWGYRRCLRRHEARASHP